MDIPPQIPERTSSKRSFQELQQDQPKLMTRRSSLASDIIHARKKLKPQGSFDSTYWNGAATVVDLELQRVEVVRQIEEFRHLNSGKDNETWEQSDNLSSLNAQEEALRVRLKSFRRQADRLEAVSIQDQDLVNRRAYITFFTEAKSGLNISSTGKGKRESDDQTRFRNTMLDSYDFKGSGEYKSFVWDIVLGTWVHHTHVIASHLFAYRHGQEAMNSIFGIESEGELFSPLNGLLLPRELEDALESGFITIVPDISDDANLKDRKIWRSSEPKNYKFRIIDKPSPDWVPGLPKNLAIKHRYNDWYDASHNIRWRDLDGKRLVFRNDFRPRARYLYYMFCLNMMRFAWRYKERSVDILQPELNKVFWGTHGRYLKRGMLRAFVEEIGHGFERLVEEGEDDTTESSKEGGPSEEDEIFTQAIAAQIAIRTAQRNLTCEELEEDEEEEGEEEDYEECDTP